MTSPLVGSPLRIEGAGHGPLAGMTFAAKDLFDVAGYPTGGGNPDWARQHPIPTRHAWAVQRLLDSGATLIGKTITDEVSLGILGENPFDGTPLNPSAPDRVPGGSSSGSASAVAQPARVVAQVFGRGVHEDLLLASARRAIVRMGSVDGVRNALLGSAHS